MTEGGTYFRIGGAIGIIPSIITFVGAWWYCAAAYGFLFGFGLGWLPAIILAAIVELALMLLWAPALVGIAIFAFEVTSRQPSDPSPALTAHSEIADEKDYSQMSDEELLHELAFQCGSTSSPDATNSELQQIAEDCLGG